jgi:hypothetical protein
VIPEAASVNEIVQHAVVSAIALGAVGVVLRRVLGVFDTRPANPPGAGGARQATPGCSHCAAGSAARHKHASR